MAAVGQLSMRVEHARFLMVSDRSDAAGIINGLKLRTGSGAE